MMIKLEHQNSFHIGVISDTHGRIPSGVLQAFKNVDLIIHAGDIGDQAVLDQLSKIAPVAAVRGNMDFGKWAAQLPETEVVEIGQTVLYVLHIVNRLDIEPEKSGYKAVISGHTHRPDVHEENGVTFINPGSASYPKFGQPGSVALIQIKEDHLDSKLIDLKN
ncbi:MAG: metallophosphoesterase family protein [Deltaproteobacteria bacterium]|jgi:putative phosphoesterase